MSDRTDHAAEARKHIEWAHEQQEMEGQFGETVQHNATLAVAEATLALVEQQRIANLIALARVESENSSTPTDAIDALWDQSNDHGRVELTTRPSIREGLGL